MATQDQVMKALDTIPEATSLVEIVNQAAREVKLNPAHLVRVAATAIRLNPKLAKCTPASFVGALIALEQVGLEPVAGRAYLLPFLNSRKVIINGKEEWHKQYEVQALIGYRGYSDLFYRHESALSIEARTVHKEDKFDYEYGTTSFLRHKPGIGDRGPATLYYSMAKMKDGAVLFAVMSREECVEHGKKHSKVYDKKAMKFMPGTPWTDDEDSMCRKTVLLQLTKTLPLSIETQKAMSVDETSREYRPGIESALDLPDTTSWDEPPQEQLAQLAQEPPPQTPPVQKVNPTIIQVIEKLRQKIGDQKFFAVLGALGFESVAQITTMKDANQLIAEIDKAHAKG